VLPELYTVS